MPTPVSEQIAVVVFTRLQVLETVGESVYEFTACNVVRPRRYNSHTPEHQQIVLMQEAPQRAPDYDCPGSPNKLAWSLRFLIVCHVMPSEEDETAVDTLKNLMWAEVIRVVATDQNWETMDDLAIESEWEDPEFIDPSGGVDGVIVPLSVTYRHSERDPFTAG